jgi:hypothetical protein
VRAAQKRPLVYAGKCIGMVTDGKSFTHSFVGKLREEVHVGAWSWVLLGENTIREIRIGQRGGRFCSEVRALLE